MPVVVVNDASCLIDLRKGQLLSALCRLPFRFVVPLPIRESELLNFTPSEWTILDQGGMDTHDLPPERIADAHALSRRFGRLSANDCFCLVTAQCHEGSILLTGDSLLRTIASTMGVRVHGVLWVVDQLKAANVCDRTLLVAALEVWRSDRSVFLPNDLIDRRLRELR